MGSATPLADGTLSTSASAICVDSFDCYLAGSTSPTVGQSRATGWKNTSGTSLSNGLNKAHADAVDFANGVAFRAGEDGRKAVYWRGQQQIPLTDGTRQAHAAAIVVFRTPLDSALGRDGDVYVGGSVNNGSNVEAVYWKNGIMIRLTDGQKASAITSLCVRIQ